MPNRRNVNLEEEAQSTWGATAEYKKQWQSKKGDAARKQAERDRENAEKEEQA